MYESHFQSSNRDIADRSVIDQTVLIVLTYICMLFVEETDNSIILMCGKLIYITISDY